MQSPMTSQSNRISGMRIRFAPPATPEWAAIQPAWRPMTSSTITRRWLSAVLARRSSASTATATADWKPKVLSVPGRSLSIVLGTPTTGTPASDSAWAIRSEPSPPMQMRASMPSWLAPSAAWATTSGWIRGRPPFGERSVKRPRLEVPRMVPPRNSSASVSRTARGRWARGGRRPSKPPVMPIASQPRAAAAMTVARMTVFKPGASPPPVTIPMRRSGGRRPVTGLVPGAPGRRRSR